MRRLASHPNLGVLLTPKSGNVAPPVGTVWACDNSAFSGFDRDAFVSMLKKISGRPDCLWVTAPDVVGDHAATMALWKDGRELIEAHGQRAAFVAQDGCTVADVPWNEAEAVFLGGTTRWKLGHEAADIIHAAKSRGVWSHMGRVNTFSRIKYAHVLGVDSVDGSKYSRWSETHIPKALNHLLSLSNQRGLEI